MCTEKNIKLSLDKARKMYGKNPEMDELLLANFTKEELTKKELPKSLGELNRISGYYLKNKDDHFFGIGKCSPAEPLEGYYDVFATEKQAKSALAMAQLSQLKAIYNGDWIEDWSDPNSAKIVIFRKNNKITADTFYCNHCFLTFKSEEIRDEFLKNFEPLIKEYFMID